MDSTMAFPTQGMPGPIGTEAVVDVNTYVDVKTYFMLPQRE